MPAETGMYSKHTGIDISGVHRDNVIAIYDGVVTIAEIQKGFGNCIEIKHEIVTYETVTDEDALIAEAEASTVIGVEISLGPYFSLPSNEVFAT